MKQRRGFARSTGRFILDDVTRQLGIRSFEPLLGDHDSLHGERSQRILAKDPALRALQQTYIVRLPPGSDPAHAAAQLRRDPLVVTTEPNYIASLDEPPGPEDESSVGHEDAATSDEPAVFDDPFLSSFGSWGQSFTDMWRLNSINARPAWKIAQGEGVVVAVIDTGLDTAHEDIAENVWTNPSEIAGNGIDDDANGFVDDANGWDFTHCDNFDRYKCYEPKDPGADVRDANGHGTFVSGIVAAVADNGVGIAGVAPRAQVMAVKAINRRGSATASELADALVYAADNGAHVINASWSIPKSDTLQKAVEYAVHGKGVTIVAAAGNAGAPLQRGVYPANCPEVLAVGATTVRHEAAEFSNYDGALDLVAPGGGDTGPEHVVRPDKSILSLAAEGSALQNPCRLIQNCDEPGCPVEELCELSQFALGREYLRASGTSFAAPAVAGVAALVLSLHPDATPEQVRQVLVETATDLNERGWDKHTGYGEVNALAAVRRGVPGTALITNIENSQKFWRQHFPLEVRGTVRAGDGDAVKAWRLSVGREGSEKRRHVASGSGEVEDGVLGKLRMGARHRLRPGRRYTLRLEVETQLGHAIIDTRTIMVPDPKYAIVPIMDPRDEGGGNAMISGDGTRIIFERGDRDTRYTTSWSTWIVDEQGPQPRLLQKFAVRPYLSRDGCVFSASTSDTIVRNLCTGSITQIPGHIAGNGPLTQNGTRLFFLSAFDIVHGKNPDQSTELYSLDLASGDIRQLSSGVPCCFVCCDIEIRSFAISSSGERAVLEAPGLVPGNNPERRSELFLIDTYAMSSKQLTYRPVDGQHPFGNIRPTISGDGSTIAWLSDDGTMAWRLSDTLPVSVTPDRADHPRLSFDGETIAYASTLDEDPTVGNDDRTYEVFVRNLSSGEINQVTDTVGKFDGAGMTEGSDTLRDLVMSGIGRTSDSSAVLSLARAGRSTKYCAPPTLMAPALIRAREGRVTRAELQASSECGDRLTFWVQRDPPVHDSGHGSGLDFLARFTLTDHGDGSAILSIEPEFDEAGVYPLKFFAFDSNGVATMSNALLSIDDTRQFGDVNCDGVVGAADLQFVGSLIFNGVGDTDCPTQDGNFDGKLSVADLVFLTNRMGQ